MANGNKNIHLQELRSKSKSFFSGSCFSYGKNAYQYWLDDVSKIAKVFSEAIVESRYILLGNFFEIEQVAIKPLFNVVLDEGAFALMMMIG